MDLTKLTKDERISARVYLRRRKRAWDHFYFLQDLKEGNVIESKLSTKFYKVLEVTESYDASPLDIVIRCLDLANNTSIKFGFSIKAYEGQILFPFLKYYNKTIHEYRDQIHSSYVERFVLNTSAEVLYGGL